MPATVNKAACVTHVRVVAAQLLGNGAGGRRPFRDDALLPKHRQQMSKAGTEVTVRAQRSGVAVAARQMVVEELIDEVFVELLGRQAAERHPMREVRQGAQVLLNAALGVAASLQQRHVGVQVRRQRAIEQPGSRQGVQRSDRVHVGLQL